jgi:hypothetical protein
VRVWLMQNCLTPSFGTHKWVVQTCTVQLDDRLGCKTKIIKTPE